MNTQEAIQILEQHQLWRKGLPPYEHGGEGMPHTPAQLGEALTYAIEHMKRGQWMPIDSAPMCEDVDLWSKYGRYVRCQHDDYGHWFIWSDGFGRYVTLSPSIKPTHWKPLPEPPQERKG